MKCDAWNLTPVICLSAEHGIITHTKFDMSVKIYNIFRHFVAGIINEPNHRQFSQRPNDFYMAFNEGQIEWHLSIIWTNLLERNFLVSILFEMRDCYVCGRKIIFHKTKGSEFVHSVGFWLKNTDLKKFLKISIIIQWLIFTMQKNHEHSKINSLSLRCTIQNDRRVGIVLYW